MTKIYYGEETGKALRNFPLVDSKISDLFILALSFVKLAEAEANYSLGKLHIGLYKIIVQAIEELKSGKLSDQFVVSSIQGGAGTSVNMNFNEVVAARATDISFGKIKVDPIEHVNLSQSTNDTLPTALRLLCLWEIDKYSEILKHLESIFLDKSKKFRGIIKVGRTHLQDAVPIRLSEEFLAYSHFVKRDISRILESKKYLLMTNLGGTAIGTFIGSSENHVRLVNKKLSQLTGYDFKPANDLIDATQNIDVFLHISSLLNISACGLSKICSDLRLMASGPRAGIGELKLPELQKGSSIMPGKTNPVTLEQINQIANHVVGNNVANSIATLSGQLELNVMLPTLTKNLTESFQMLINGVEKLSETIKLIEADKIHCKELFDRSLVGATELSEKIGYHQTSEIVKSAIIKNTTLEEEFTKSLLDK